MVDLKQVKTRFRSLQKHLDERTRRLFAAAESEAIGRGGISAVSAATGISRRVIRQGKKELHARAVKLEGRQRRPGGGRKRTASEDPLLLVDLERLLEPVTRGDPESRYGGLARAFANWLKNWSAKAIRPATGQWPGCWMASAIACKPIERSAKVVVIRTGMRSSSTSTPRLVDFSGLGNQ